MKYNKEELLSRLDKIESLSKGSKLNRLFNNPFKYLNGLLFWKLSYNKTKKGKIKTCQTFFSSTIEIVLPAGMDLYLLGAKSHDSEIRLAKFLVKQINEGDTFLDIGAHFGYYSLLASYLVGQKGSVVGIEAAPAIFQILNKNANDIGQLEVFNIAATSKNNEISFFEFPILFSEYNTIYPEQFEQFAWLKENPPKKVNVQGKSMDDLINDLAFLPNIIKIDVEGAEYDVISGLKHTIEKHAPIIAMEYLLDNRNQSSHQKALDLLLSNGYKANLIDQNGGLKLLNTTIQEAFDRKNLESDNIIFCK